MHGEQLIASPYDEEADVHLRHVSLQKGLLYNVWVLSRDSRVLTISPAQSLLSVALCLLQIILTFSLIKGPGAVVWWHFLDVTRVTSHMLLRLILLYVQYRVARTRALEVTSGVYTESHAPEAVIFLLQFGLWVSNLLGLLLVTMLPFFLLFVAVTPNLDSSMVLTSCLLAGLTLLLHGLATLPQCAFIKRELGRAQLREIQAREAPEPVAPPRSSPPVATSDSNDANELQQALAAIARMELKAKQDLEYQQALTDAEASPIHTATQPESEITQTLPPTQDVSVDVAALESKKARLGEEPAADIKEGVVNIQVRFPSGKVMRRRFWATSPLQSLFDAVETFSPEGVRGTSGEDITSCYEIQCNFPKTTLDPLGSAELSLATPLQTAGFTSSHSFFVKEKIDAEEE